MLHICYILPIFRIKKAPIGAVACPQWVDVKCNVGDGNKVVLTPLVVYSKLFGIVFSDENGGSIEYQEERLHQYYWQKEDNNIAIYRSKNDFDVITVISFTTV